MCNGVTDLQKRRCVTHSCCIAFGSGKACDSRANSPLVNKYVSSGCQGVKELSVPAG